MMTLAASPSNRTTKVAQRAIEQQIRAMGCSLFEIGLYKIDASAKESPMIIRTWDAETIVASVRWLRHQNAEGRNIYIRPKGEHNLTLIDDLTLEKVSVMKQTGFRPAVIVETSTGNYQAWLKHPEVLNKRLSTVAARALATKFGGDHGAADWRHFGRLSGFTNQKVKYCDPVTGLYPFVRLIEANGEVFREAERFLAELKQQLEKRQRENEAWQRQLAKASRPRNQDLKSIDTFRGDPRYRGDGNRIDLAFAVYALSHGAPAIEVQTAIRSRDLSHKGNEGRQTEYVERTVKKALATLERGR
jgi:hypothetical protein